MDDFFDKAEDTMRTACAKSPGQRKAFELVFDAIADMQNVFAKANLDLRNLEEVFSAFEMVELLGVGSPTQNLPAKLRKIIVLTLQNCIIFPAKGKGLGPTPEYQAFANVVKRLFGSAVPVTIITFNYDLASEVALSAIGMGTDYHLPGYERDGISVLKLHGSMNWAHCAKGEEGCRKLSYVKVGDLMESNCRPGDSRSTRRIGGLHNIRRCLASCKHCGFAWGQGPPFIVPPTWSKGGYHAIIQPVWKTAAQHLSEAEHIFISGYSMPKGDHFFRSLYALGTRGPARLRSLVLCDPTLEAVERRFRTFLGPLAEEVLDAKEYGFGEFPYYCNEVLVKAGVLQPAFP